MRFKTTVWVCGLCAVEAGIRLEKHGRGDTDMLEYERGKKLCILFMVTSKHDRDGRSHIAVSHKTTYLGNNAVTLFVTSSEMPWTVCQNHPTQYFLRERNTRPRAPEKGRKQESWNPLPDYRERDMGRPSAAIRDRQPPAPTRRPIDESRGPDDIKHLDQAREASQKRRNSRIIG